MYPIKLGFSEAQNRINSLHQNGHYAEALITTVFTFEKSVRRGINYLALARGFTSKYSKTLFENYGFAKLKTAWPIFDRTNSTLPDFVGSSWAAVPGAVTMRNKMAHGEKVYDLQKCKVEAVAVMNAVIDLRTNFLDDVGYDLWTKLPVRRLSKLSWDTSWHKKSKAKAFHAS